MLICVYREVLLRMVSQGAIKVPIYVHTHTHTPHTHTHTGWGWLDLLIAITGILQDFLPKCVYSQKQSLKCVTSKRTLCV